MILEFLMRITAIGVSLFGFAHCLAILAAAWRDHERRWSGDNFEPIHFPKKFGGYYDQ